MPKNQSIQPMYTTSPYIWFPNMEIYKIKHRQSSEDTMGNGEANAKCLLNSQVERIYGYGTKREGCVNTGSHT